MIRFLALDFETSGVDPKRHAPVSLGVALFEDGTVVDKMEWLIGPALTKDGKIKREYDVSALEISRSSWSKIKQASTPFEVCGELNHFARAHKAQELPIIAFNATFDNAFYSELLFDAGSWDQINRCFMGFKPPLIGGWFCARMKAFHTLDLQRYSLDAVAAECGLTRSTEAHGALEDAILAGKVWLHLNQDVFDQPEAVPA